MAKIKGKIENDKYYTPPELAKELIDKTFKIVGNVTDIIEPSAGDGSFSKQLDCVAYDIEPEDDSIIKQDFLELKIPYKEGRLIIGNPPFGCRNAGSVKFFKKACELGDYIAFIQPISQLNNNLQMYYFDLVHSEDLGVVKYSDRELHCCFNIYKRPANGLNSKPDYTLKDITIKEWRRGGSYSTPPDGWDYAMANFGNGNMGKIPEYVGQYCQEVYFYCHKKEYLPKLLELLEYSTIRGYVESISAKKISVMRLYKYLRDNIEEIE